MSPAPNSPTPASTDDGSAVPFSYQGAALDPGAASGHDNLYVWDRESGEVFLVSVDNDEQALPKGAFGGSYDWAFGMSATNLSQGGGARGYYLQGTHAITAAGDIYFTEAGSGQLYLR